MFKQKKRTDSSNNVKKRSSSMIEKLCQNPFSICCSLLIYIYMYTNVRTKTSSKKWKTDVSRNNKCYMFISFLDFNYDHGIHHGHRPHHHDYKEHHHLDHHLPVSLDHHLMKSRNFDQNHNLMVHRKLQSLKHNKKNISERNLYETLNLPSS